MRRSFFAFYGLLLLVYVARGFAMEPGPLLPPLQAHVSVSSPREMIAKADVLAVAMTAGSRREIKSGVIPALMNAVAVLPPGSWRDDAETHFIFLGHRQAPDNVVMIVSANGMDAFVAGLAEKDLEASVTEENGRKSAVVRTADGSSIAAVDMGDSRIALASRMGTIDIALAHLRDGAWESAHPAGVDVRVSFSVAAIGDMSNPMNAALVELREHRSEMLEEIKAMNVNPKLGEAALEMLEKFLPAMGEEMLRLRSLAFDFRFGADKVVIEAVPGTASGSYLEKMAASLSAPQSANTELAEAACADNWAVLAGASPDRMFPGLGEGLAAAAAVLDRHLHEGGGKMPRSVAPLLDAVGEGWIAAVGMERELPAVTLAVATPPSALLAALDGFLEAANETIGAAFLHPSLRFAVKGTRPGDAEDKRDYRIAFDSPRDIDAMLQYLGEGMPSFSLGREDIESRTLRVGGEGERTIITTGEPENAAWAAADARVDAAAPRTEAFRAVYTSLPYRQGGVAAVEADRVLEMLLVELLKRGAANADAERTGAYLEAVARLFPMLRKSGDWLGFSLGARDGGPVLGVCVPYSVLNAAFVNQEMFSRLVPAGAPANREQ